MGRRVPPKKSLGQHFLRDDEVREEILRWARLGPEDAVLEIGAGDGTLTGILGEKAGRVCAVETDRRLLPLLRRQFPPGGPVEVIEADILDFDLSSLLPLAPLKVVADLPYNIAVAVLDMLLDRRELFILMILMFQKEVALRLVAAAGTRDYGSLSLATQYRSEAEIIRIVPPESFRPRPKVDSALVQVLPRREPLLPPGEERLFMGLAEGGFRHRRKTFLNSLARAGLPVPAGKVEAALEELGLPLNVRAEDISFQNFISLARILAPHVPAPGSGQSPPLPGR